MASQEEGKNFRVPDHHESITKAIGKPQRIFLPSAKLLANISEKSDDLHRTLPWMLRAQ
jgi:hypothetical protein